MAWPLLASHEDRVRAAKTMLQVIPSSRKPQDAVVLMGHGSVKHPADAIYAAMNQVFMDMDPNVHVGTAEYPAMVDI